MKSLPVCVNNGHNIDDDDDIFGPPRAYTPDYYTTGGSNNSTTTTTTTTMTTTTTQRQRPSMISAKYRQKEERRKVLKISVNKLKRIEDPEASLCRSVLINNTMKRLQKETKDEKNSLQVVRKPVAPPVVADFAIDMDDLDITAAYATSNSRKRPATDLDLDDCDVHDVLSQFYMPPTPRMLTTIDDGDDEEENTKRPRFDDDLKDLTASAHATVPAYSCGHASMFNDLQNNVFHSLVASLET